VPVPDDELNREPRSISRYKQFRRSEVKIHPFRRLAKLIGGCLPRTWRFFVTGLPPRATSDPAISEDVLPWAKPKLMFLRDGIATRMGAHLDRNGAYLPEMTLGAGAFMETRFLQRQRFFPRIKTVEGRVLSLAFEAQINYYRWLIETLPRMRFAMEEGCTFDWIYACQKAPFHRETLRLLGCPPERIISAEMQPILRAREIVAPRFIDECEPWIIPWLREKFLPLAAQDASIADRPRRFYLTRGRATSRRSRNEAALLAMLERFDFVSVTAENLTWLDQVALFRDAEAIVAPHGAGLANLAFCTRGALVVELIAEGYPFTFFPEMGRRLRLAYHMMECPPADAARVAMSDLLVDVARVEGIVEDWEATRRRC
jgi:hypothetical protein